MQPVDLREQTTDVTGQEIMTADRVTLRLNAVVTWRVIDPERFAMLQEVHVRASGDRLYFDVPGHGLTWMHPMGKGRFFFKDHSGNRVMFDLDQSKRARGMVLKSKNAAFAFTRR